MTEPGDINDAERLRIQIEQKKEQTGADLRNHSEEIERLSRGDMSASDRDFIKALVLYIKSTLFAEGPGLTAQYQSAEQVSSSGDTYDESSAKELYDRLDHIGQLRKDALLNFDKDEESIDRLIEGDFSETDKPFIQRIAAFFLADLAWEKFHNALSAPLSYEAHTREDDSEEK